MAKMVKCKSCGAEIAKTANSCAEQSNTSSHLSLALSLCLLLLVR